MELQQEQPPQQEAQSFLPPYRDSYEYFLVLVVGKVGLREVWLHGKRGRDVATGGMVVVSGAPT